MTKSLREQLCGPGGPLYYRARWYGRRPGTPHWGFRVTTARENGKLIWITEARSWDGSYGPLCRGVPVKVERLAMDMILLSQ